MASRKVWILRLVLLASPFLLLLVLEGGLHLFGYRVPQSFTVSRTIDGQDYHVPNEVFSYRFFPRAIARQPIPFSYGVNKPPETVRIFVTGGSAAFGDLRPIYSVGRCLEVMLADRYPGVHFEIINVAMTAINSHVVREIVAEVARQDADMVIVYLGNNEVVGPYGAGNRLVPMQSSRSLIHARLWLNSTAIGQLAGDIARSLSTDDDAPKTWRGMEHFLDHQVRHDAEELATVYDHFRENLSDICDVTRDAGVPLILSTVGVNLRHCAPFGSQHRVELANSAEWDTLFARGIKHEVAGEDRQAADSYRQALAIDDQFAELAFRLARIELAAGSAGEARQLFARARDLDTLRFRADSTINETIRTVATDRREDGVRLVDGAAAFAAATPAAVPGRESFSEHVHMNFAGNHVLALALLEIVEAELPAWARERRVDRPALDLDTCCRRLTVTRRDRLKLIQDTINRFGRPPFVDQLDISVLIEEFRQAGNALHAAIAAQPVTDEPAIYQEALDSTHSRFATIRLHQRYGKFLLEVQNQPDLAEQQFEQALALDPDRKSILHDLGMALLRLRRPVEAVERFRRAVELDPDYARAHYALGMTLAATGDPRGAEYHRRRATELNSPGAR